jgi:hypothetical protein
VTSANQPADIAPLSVPIEPQPLNEATSAMIIDRSQGTDAMPANPADAGLKRHIHPNVILRGGYAIMILFLIYWAMAALESWQQGRLKPALFAWTAGLLILLFLPINARLIGGVQWLVVPGGVLVRRAGWREGGWKLRLFRPDRSVLCAARHRKRRWGVDISDAERCESTVATQAEVEFLLSAWLSPLPPPPLERLSDLV